MLVFSAAVGLGGKADVGLHSERPSGIGDRSVDSVSLVIGWPLAQRPAPQAAEKERAEATQLPILSRVGRLHSPLADPGLVEVPLAPRPRDSVPSVPPAGIAAAIRETLRGRGWEEWRIDDAICVNGREDRTGVAVRHEEDGTHSYGSYQLNTEGRLPDFYARGYDDPFAVEQQANWLADIAGEWDGSWWNFWQPWLSAREACL